MTYSNMIGKSERGMLDGQFVIAMPSMVSGMFARSVVYICAHSEAGTMGFILNRPQAISLTDVLKHVKIAADDDPFMLPEYDREMPILIGGPVESGRGFVLHSDDYTCPSTMPVSDDISMTTTLDVLRAVYSGTGPKKATMMLGYAGWGPGQLEAEIADSNWINCPANEALIFDRLLDNKYERALALLGIDSNMLSGEIGHC